jgi:hypothetical protein
MVSKYTEPELTNHKILYKGKRYWVFEISKENPYENMENVCSIIVFDKLCGGIAGYCNYKEDGTIVGDIPYSQQSIDIEGKDGKEISGLVDYWTKWIERTEK